MALVWDWKKKCGEMVIRQTYDGEVKDFTINLYEGNAYLIMTYEYKHDEKDMYSLQGFFLDKTHMKRMLGLAKGYTVNHYNKPNDKVISIRLNKAKCTHTTEIVEAFAKAFDNLKIEIYKED